MPSITNSDLILFATIFLASFTQSLSGFGSALIAMAVLAPLLGALVATPLVALFVLVLEIVLLLWYHKSLNIRAVWRITAASVVGIPFGVVALRLLPESLVLFLLGLVVSGYAVYALLDFKLPRLESSGWAYGFGFIAGLLGGAYNTSGPPVIIYGNCRGWEPAEFKANLQGFFFASSTLVLAGHAVSGNLSPLVWQKFGLSLPFAAVGILAGLLLERKISPHSFRKLVLVLLVGLGLRLLF